MDELVKGIFSAPIGTLFVIAGLVFLGIAVVGKISGKIEPGRGGRIASGVLGLILLGTGLAMYNWDNGPGPSSTPTPATVIPPTATLPATPQPTTVVPPTTILPATPQPVTPTPWVPATPVNRPPVANGDQPFTKQGNPTTFNVLSNDFDPDGDPLTINDWDKSSRQGGGVICIPKTGECTYTPPAGFLGNDSFAYVISDGKEGFSKAAVAVIVQPPIAPGTVQGRVLWNEQPVAGATVYATDLYSFDSTKYGNAATDANGEFSISGVPDGEQYLYVFGNQPGFWVAAVTPFQMISGRGTRAADSYLCKGFDPISPQKDERVSASRPTLRWAPFPNAVDYAVRVSPAGKNTFIFQRGDNDKRISDTNVQVNVELTPGTYRWRVDAFDALGHIIGCSYFPREFTVIEKPIPTPALTLSGTESYEANGKQWVRYQLAITNWADFPAELFASAPDLPPCGSNHNASRTWVNIYDANSDKGIYGFCALSSPQSLNSIWFAVEQGTQPPQAVYVVLTDRKTNTTYRSNEVSVR